MTGGQFYLIEGNESNLRDWREVLVGKYVCSPWLLNRLIVYKCQVGEGDDFADQQISNKFFERDWLKSWRTNFLKNNLKNLRTDINNWARDGGRQPLAIEAKIVLQFLQLSIMVDKIKQ